MPSANENARLAALTNRARSAFQRAYGDAPTHVVAAPGRVNLIGEHTDYNDGFVLPAAIDRHALMAIGPRNDNQVRIVAVDLNARSSFSLDQIDHDQANRWSNYQRGVAWALQGEGLALRGMNMVLTSDVPVGSGLSSSAAVEVATAFAFQVLSEFELNGVTRALLCQKAENDFVGMNCGIMDQFIVSLGSRGHALLIDCRSLDYQAVPVPEGCSVVICDTKKRRGLVDSEYNLRRQECERGAEILGVRALRDVTLEQLVQRRGAMDALTYRRCHHVVSENERTQQAVSALRNNDVAKFGKLMDASHVSLRDDYQVSCLELDEMVAAAWAQPGTLGSRMTGAGFGGCTVSLVESAGTDAFVQDVARTYQSRTGLRPEVYVCQAEDGVGLVSLTN
ncbi:MAG: galactokinase [Anaerolineae bacterium]|jgi:galactokinase|nr:galactokinase [Chloroflexota bacterium]